MFLPASRWIASTAIASAFVLAATSAAPAANLVKTFRDWSLFSHTEAQSKICFAASQPKESTPANSKRDPAFFYVSAWPKDGVKSEVSVRLGYPIKKGSTVTVDIGGTSFDLFAKDDKAFVADPTQELKLIEAMKRGTIMKVEATSEQGTTTADSYSLMGISNALEGLATECP
jgi:invasion protein IalB